MEISILAVDDDPLVLELLCDALELGGYDNVTALQDPIEASELVRSGAVFDVVILDIQMPGMDGIELCQIIRNTEHLRFTPIVMLTAMHDKAYVNRSFAAGADDYVNKPFDPLDVCIRIERALSISRLKRNAHEHSLGGQAAAAQTEPMLLSLDGTVPEATLRNYLSQLSRCSASNAVVAIEVLNMTELQTLASDQYEQILNNISATIKAVLKETSNLLCYIEHGVFLCVAQTSTNVFDGFMRSAIEDRANRQEGTLAANKTVQLRFGETLRCPRLRSVDVEATLVRAVGSLRDVSQDGVPMLAQGGGA